LRKIKWLKSEYSKKKLSKERRLKSFLKNEYFKVSLNEVSRDLRLRRFKIMDISKKDWKLFQERLSGWQENYMESLVKEYANFLNDDKKPASEKFWELEKRIKEDKRHPGVIMELKKSEVIWDIVRLIRLKVTTYDDLSDFSDELQMEVKRILEISK
jgi:hypothetical protein